MDIRDFAKAVHQNSVDHGFWDGQKYEERSLLDQEMVWDTIPLKLMLIVTEAAEAMEAYREWEPGLLLSIGPTGKPEGLGSELADIIIRTLDLAQALNIDIEYVLLKKHAYNKSRPHKHGKTC